MSRKNNKSAFENALTNELNDEKVLTENGAVAYKTSGKKLVDLNFAVTSLRSASEEDIEKMFFDAFYEDKMLAMRWLFFARDIRGKGLGERRLFRTCLKKIANLYPAMTKGLIPLVAEYGREDDLFVLEGTQVWQDVVDYIDKKLAADVDAMENGKSVSLLAKWLPSINTSSDATRALAKKLVAALDLTDRKYRKMLSKLRKYIDVIEVKTSASDWQSINYEHVPSKANLKYKDAFLKHDTDRRKMYLDKLSKGEAKINVGTLSVVDIVNKYIDNSGWGNHVKNKIDDTIEAAWKALPTTFETTQNVIAVVDGSGSMTTKVGSTNVSALTVANALGIYFSERLNGPFKDKFITFSCSPKFVDFSNCDTLLSKVKFALSHDECSNTDIYKTMMLVLKAAKNNKLKQEDIPNILILSDMEFDCATGNYYDRSSTRMKTLFDDIAKEFEENGYKLPRLTFWNICGRTGGVPMKQNDYGVGLVSGFSQNICNMVMSNKLDPFDVLKDSLMDKRYDAVEKALNKFAQIA